MYLDDSDRIKKGSDLLLWLSVLCSSFRARMIIFCKIGYKCRKSTNVFWYDLKVSFYRLTKLYLY